MKSIAYLRSQAHSSKEKRLKWRNEGECLQLSYVIEGICTRNDNNDKLSILARCLYARRIPCIDSCFACNLDFNRAPRSVVKKKLVVREREKNL